MIGLIGHTGFVGSSLLEQVKIDKVFNSKNISEVKNYDFKVLICAGMSGSKWIANSNPSKDNRNYIEIINNLKLSRTENLVLISTVDTFFNPINVDEDSSQEINKLETYGKNRKKLEVFVMQNFKNYLIVRLTGLVGAKLKKNLLYDIKNNNELYKFNLESKYQFYPIRYLWKDIQIAKNNNINLIHLNSEPISVKEIANISDKETSEFTEKKNKAAYDLLTKHGKVYKTESSYLYDKDKVVSEIKEYFQN